MVLFKSNCIILHHNLSIDAKHIISPYNSSNITTSNISIEANIVDPDQTAPKGAVWSRSTLFVYEASNILVDDKKNPYILWLCA